MNVYAQNKDMREGNSTDKRFREVIDIMDGVDARRFWYDVQIQMKGEGGDYDPAIDNEVWLRRYLLGFCD